MTTIKPSEGVQYARKTIFVEGKIAGAKSHTALLGGRWVVPVADIDSSTGRSDATLVLNENPDENPTVRALGVRQPSRAVLSLFSAASFNRLFQPGMTFRGEAIVGVYNGTAWFNVWEIILFEPQFMIGVRQVYNEPICERRLSLRARGMKANRIRSDINLGGSFVGNMVHSTFQEIATSPIQENLITEFRSDPKKFLLRAIQPEAILIGAMGLLGDSPRLSGNEWSTAKNQIQNLIDSSIVQNLLAKETKWFSEVPVSGKAIHGDIDLRSPSRILELKTGLQHPAHENQLSVYLVGEMLENGFAVKNYREAYIVRSSSQIQDDCHRVQLISGNSPQILESLERFLLARHRLLLVSGGKKLPKIDLDPAACQREPCEYYLTDQPNVTTCGCHFYCQTDRNWSCAGCKHSAQCVEHSKHHSFDILDEANHLRNALNQEIELHRKRTERDTDWTGQFEIVGAGVNRTLLLRPTSGNTFEPPSPGEKIVIKPEQQDYPTNGLMVAVSENDDWIVINRGAVSSSLGSRIQLIQPRSELNGMYQLLGCLDELQRLGDVSHREGISFAGGGIVFGRPEITDNLHSVISDTSVTDTFCQSFGVSLSRQLLEQVVGTVKGRILVVTDAKAPPINGTMDIRGAQVLEFASKAHSISDALNIAKTELENHPCWVISSDILLNTDVCSALPNRGRGFFDYIIIYETNGITGLEYFLMREFGKHMLTIGDANCVGRPLHSQQSKLLGLGDNLMTRVYHRGFPKIEGKVIPKLVCLKNQPINSLLNRGLLSCRMICADKCDSEGTIHFISCDFDCQDSPDRLIHSCEFAVPSDGPPKELKLKIKEVILASDIEDDLRELASQINSLLVEDQVLTAPTSGRRYTVRQAPGNRSDGGILWLVQVFSSPDQLGTNRAEAVAVIEKVRDLRQSGVKSKNLAVMSASPKQLAMIAQQYESDLRGIALRTPYGIRGESWGNVIITCATQTVQKIDVRELYTMIRASRTRVFIVAAPNVIHYHPLFRNMQKSAERLS